MSTNPTTLPMDIIVDVVVQIAPQAPALPTFNQGLIIGPSTVIPSVAGVNPRIRRYTSLAQMLADGFNVNSPEYIAASIYFGQTPAPQYLYVGRRDETVGAVLALKLDAAGANYVAGDVLNVVQVAPAETGCHVVVDTVDGNGAITSFHMTAQGTAYVVANGLATTGGTGAGATFDVTKVSPESALDAVQACRAANFLWYAFMVTDAVKADHEAIAAWAQSAAPSVLYFFGTHDADVPGGIVGNIFSVLKAGAYNRVFGLYSTDQNGLFPNNIYIAAAAMGVAMGMNTGLANSFFTMKFKTLTGIAVEPLDLTTIQTIEGNNGNLYLSYGNSYSFMEQGVVSDGQFVDEIVNLDMLVSDMQYSVLNLLAANPAIPQTDAGETQLIHAVNQACERARVRGFIAAGVWQGQQLLNLNPGDPVPNGYLCQAQSFATQSASDRQARKAMPIYVAITEAGAIHSILIGVYVQR